MKKRQIIGLETEYAALTRAGGHLDLDILFSGWQRPYQAKWDYGQERPWNDARGFVPIAQGSSDLELPLQLVATKQTHTHTSSIDHMNESQNSVDISQQDPPSVMLRNGARFYLDHAHPEWCTPECATPREVLAYDKAGDVWLNDLLSLINANRADSEKIKVYKNNVDMYGNTYGCHENYLIDAHTYVSLFDQHTHRLFSVLLPFLVSRQILCGSGKIAPVDHSPDVGFHISQRADFFKSVIGLQTTHNRPLINTRDEPHADPQHFRRLHLIIGDANLSEYSVFLKVGTTSLILEMLAQDRLRLDLMLANPLRAVRQISQDPTCKQTVELETAGRFYTAVDIQRCFLEAVGNYLDEIADHTYRREVWQEWSIALDCLEQEPELMSTRIDWVIKHEYLKMQKERNSLEWSSPQIRELDFRYHQIDPEHSLFHLLQNNGLIDRLLTDDDIRQAINQPPQTTRAHLRTQCLNKFGDQILAVNWDAAVYQDEAGNTWRWRWQDPTDNGGNELEKQMIESNSLAEFARNSVTTAHTANTETK